MTGVKKKQKTNKNHKKSNKQKQQQISNCIIPEVPADAVASPGDLSAHSRRPAVCSTLPRLHCNLAGHQGEHQQEQEPLDLRENRTTLLL